MTSLKMIVCGDRTTTDVTDEVITFGDHTSNVYKEAFKLLKEQDDKRNGGKTDTPIKSPRKVCVISAVTGTFPDGFSIAGLIVKHKKDRALHTPSDIEHLVISSDVIAFAEQGTVRLVACFADTQMSYTSEAVTWRQRNEGNPREFCASIPPIIANGNSADPVWAELTLNIETGNIRYSLFGAETSSRYTHFLCDVPLVFPDEGTTTADRSDVLEIIIDSNQDIDIIEQIKSKVFDQRMTIRQADQYARQLMDDGLKLGTVALELTNKDTGKTTRSRESLWINDPKDSADVSIATLYSVESDAVTASAFLRFDHATGVIVPNIISSPDDKLRSSVAVVIKIPAVAQRLQATIETADTDDTFEIAAIVEDVDFSKSPTSSYSFCARAGTRETTPGNVIGVIRSVACKPNGNTTMYSFVYSGDSAYLINDKGYTLDSIK